MKITVTIDVRDDGYRHHTYQVDEDQEPFSIIANPDDDRPDRSLEAVRKSTLRRTREALERLLRQAEA
jgi:hypothetical protein